MEVDSFISNPLVVFVLVFSVSEIYNGLEIESSKEVEVYRNRVSASIYAIFHDTEIEGRNVYLPFITGRIFSVGAH